MRLIHITGKKGSGKSTVLHFLKKKGCLVEEVDWGFKLLQKHFPDLLKRLPHPQEWEHHIIQLVYECYWKKRYTKNETVFFCGLYRTSEIDYLKSEKALKAIIAVVVSDDSVRYNRLLKRRRPGEENLSLEDFVLKDMHRDGFPGEYKRNNLSKIINMADFILKNDGDFYALEQEIEKMLKYLRQRKLI